MKKQIEKMQEMASILTEASHLACEDIPSLPSDMTICYKIPCHRCKETRLLLYKGYRKASEVAGEFITAVDSMLNLVCEMTGLELKVFGKYADLKKKYTEDGE